MSTCLEANRIPAEPIAVVIRAYLGSMEGRRGEAGFTPGGVRTLAERADINEDTLQKILVGRTKTIDFDLADRLLCITNMNDLWLTDLRELYESAVLPEGEKQFKVSFVSGRKVCARVGCSETFIPPKIRPGKMFCSPTCMSANAWQRKNGIKSRARGKGRKLELLTCKNGHDRTSENTRIDPNGVRRCLDCQRKSDAEYRARQRAQKHQLAVG